VIITKGDASPVSIPGVDFPVNNQNFIGRVKFVIPQIGFLIIPPINYVLVGVIISAVAIVIFINERKRGK
jgi:signal peptidase